MAVFGRQCRTILYTMGQLGSAAVPLPSSCRCTVLKSGSAEANRADRIVDESYRCGQIIGRHNDRRLFVINIAQRSRPSSFSRQTGRPPTPRAGCEQLTPVRGPVKAVRFSDLITVGRSANGRCSSCYAQQVARQTQSGSQSRYEKVNPEFQGACLCIDTCCARFSWERRHSLHDHGRSLTKTDFQNTPHSSPSSLVFERIKVR